MSPTNGLDVITRAFLHALSRMQGARRARANITNA